MDKFITSFEIHNQIVHENETAFMSTDFVNWIIDL